MTEQVIRLICSVVGIVSAVIATSLGLVSWSYDTFETKENVKERLISLERRLERIENKIDEIRARN